MPTRSGSRVHATSLVLSAILAALTLDACAAPTTMGSAGSSAVAGPSPAGSVAAVATGSAPAVPGSAAEPRATVGTGTSIPSAPDTAGSGGQPPPVTQNAVTSGPGSVVTPLPDCRPGTLKTKVPGTLTFTATVPLTAPWYVGEDPGDGRGFDAALAAAVAGELGFGAGQVAWTRSDPATVIAGRGRGFDVAVGEFAIPDQPDGSVDYSTGYFSVSQSVVARPGSAAARVTSSADLKSLRVASISTSPTLTPVRPQRFDVQPSVSFLSVPAALAALAAGAVDAVVLPTPAAIAAGSAVTVVGQLTDPTEQPQQLGLVLAKSSTLTSCVSAAVDQLRVTGTLDTLVKTWVPAAARPLS